MIKEAIIKLAKKQDLTYAEAEAVMNEIMSGEATPVQMASYLTALAMKGETIDEITASAAGMRAHCVQASSRYGCTGDRRNRRRRIEFLQYIDDLLTCHRSRQACRWQNMAIGQRPPKSGAADVLEALGVKITVSRRRKAPSFWKRSISVSCLRRIITWQ